MNRSKYYDYIEEKLHALSNRIVSRGKVNLLNLNIHSEFFFADFLNLLYGYNFRNLNDSKHNVEAIDIVDIENRIIAQVSSVCTKKKIVNSLNKKILADFKGYRFLFISIAIDASNLKKKSFATSDGITFNPTRDIIDISALLKTVLNSTIDKQKDIYSFIQGELGNENNIVKMQSNLATIINILSADNLVESIVSPEINVFHIDSKISFNDLESIRNSIDDYKIYYHKLDEIYSTFDREGFNKSFSVFQTIRKIYAEASHNERNPSKIFCTIIENVTEKVVSSANYSAIPFEELDVCVHILVVDAFIRCKIYKNPEGYMHVVT